MRSGSNCLKRKRPRCFRNVAFIYAGNNRAITLTGPIAAPKLIAVELHLKPQTESLLQELAAKTGRPPADLVEDAMAGYLEELGETRAMLDSRYDDLRSGRVKAIDGEAAFVDLRQKSKKRRSRP